MGGPEVDVIGKSLAVVGGTLGEGWRGRRRHNKETGLSREPVVFWGWHAGHRQPTAVPVAQIVRKSARVREEQRKCIHLRQAEH